MIPSLVIREAISIPDDHQAGIDPWRGNACDPLEKGAKRRGAAQRTDRHARQRRRSLRVTTNRYVRPSWLERDGQIQGPADATGWTLRRASLEPSCTFARSRLSGSNKP